MRTGAESVDILVDHCGSHALRGAARRDPQHPRHRLHPVLGDRRRPRPRRFASRGRRRRQGLYRAPPSRASGTTPDRPRARARASLPCAAGPKLPSRRAAPWAPRLGAVAVPAVARAQRPALAHGNLLAEEPRRPGRLGASASPTASAAMAAAACRSTSSRPARSCRLSRCSTRSRTARSRWATPPPSTGRARSRRPASSPRCRSASGPSSIRPGSSCATARRSGTSSTAPSACGPSSPATPARRWAAGSAAGSQGPEDLKGHAHPRPGARAPRSISGSAPCRWRSPPATSCRRSRRGSIDAAEFLAPATDLETGLPRYAPFYYAPGFNKPNGASEFLISLRAWEQLAEDLRAIVARGLPGGAHARPRRCATSATPSPSTEILGRYPVTLEAFPRSVMDGRAQGVGRAHRGDRGQLAALAAASSRATRRRSRAARLVGARGRHGALPLCAS